MRPGEENLDGPPIHGNTRPRVVWTAVPAIMLVCPLHLRLPRPARHREARSAGNERQITVTGQQFTWTFAYNERAARSSRLAQLYVPEGELGEVQRGDAQGRPARLLGPRVPPEDRRRARHPDPLPRHAEQAAGSYPVVCAELCGLGPRLHAPSAHVLDQERLRQVGLRDDGTQAGRGQHRRGRGGQAAAVDAKAIFARGKTTGATAAAAATSSLTRARRAVSGRISTRS